MDVTFTIGSPIITSGNFFIAGVVDASNFIPPSCGVFTERNNSPFTLSCLEPGDYILIVGYNGLDGVHDPCATQYCFTVVEECECPTVTDPSYTVIDGIPYFQATVSLPDGMPECGLMVSWQGTNPSPSGFDTGSIVYTDPSQIFNIGGTDYLIKLYFGINTAYNVQIYANCCNNHLLKCNEYSFTLPTTGGGGGGAGRCDGNQLVGGTTTSFGYIGGIVPTLIRDGSDNIYISLHVPAQTLPPPYAPITVTYLEDFGCDSGSVEVTLPNTTPPFDYVVPQQLTPCVPWTNGNGGLYHNAYTINVYSCDGTDLIGRGDPTAPAP